MIEEDAKELVTVGLDGFKIPEWISIDDDDDVARVSDALLSRQYNVRGKLLKTLRQVMKKERSLKTSAVDEISMAAVSKENEIAIGELLKQGLLIPIDGSSGVPHFIPTQLPLFGARQFTPDATECSLTIFGAPSNVGNQTTSGTAEAPQALRRLAYAAGIHHSSLVLKNVCRVSGIDIRRISCFSDLNSENEDRFKLFDAGDIVAFVGSPASLIHERIYNSARRILDAGSIPFMLGGDHSVSSGSLLACSKSAKSFSIIHLDAHTDCYVNRVMSLPDFKDYPSNGSVMSWALEKIPGIKNIYQFGIRGIINLLQTAHDKQVIFPYVETRAIASGASSHSIPDESEPVYLSIDIDILDPSVVPGTANPVPGGLALEELLYVIAHVMEGRKLLGVDFVELDISRDRDALSQWASLQVIAFIIALVKSGVVKPAALQ